MMEGNNYSLSDIAAITGENGLGGNSAWLIILFLLIFGGGNFFNRGNTGAGTDYMSQFDKISTQINAIGDGISSLGYNQLGKMDTMQMETQKNIDSLRYDMSQGFCAVKTASAENTQKILDAMAQSKIESLQARISQLELANATAATVKYPTATTYTSGANPFCGCGCNQ